MQAATVADPFAPDDPEAYGKRAGPVENGDSMHRIDRSTESGSPSWKTIEKSVEPAGNLSIVGWSGGRKASLAPPVPEDLSAMSFGHFVGPRTPDPEEVECLLRNAELRDAIEPFLDESIEEIDFRSLPTPVENQYLESMLAWERASLLPVSHWVTPPLILPPAHSLDDGSLRQELWQLIERLFEMRVVLDFTDHLSDRDLYALIRRDILPTPIKRVDLPDNYFHWDCSASESGDLTSWLAYYASDDEREEWAVAEGRDPPPRLVPAYPRALPTAPV